jgi:short subunit dehydrogenase-like uncharacterized protein
MITLFGATGYTGRLVARALAATGLPLRLAGRSPERLTALAAELPGSPRTLVADVAAPASLEALAEGTRVLVSCAGPFTDVGRPVAALSARKGLRYLDTTNELGFVHGVYGDYDAAARATGATLVPACAFEVALADCAAALLARQLQGDAGAIDEVSVVYWLPGMGSSLGTRASALRSLATSWLAYRGGRFVAARPASTTRAVERDGRRQRAIAFPSSETATVPAHLRVRDVTTWLAASRAGALYAPLLIPLAAPLLRGPLGAGLRWLAERAAPPPDDERRTHMPFTIRVEARAAGRAAALTLSGRDPYGLTARIVAHAAMRLYSGDAPSGVVPPALALDPAALLDEARRWGVEMAEA